MILERNQERNQNENYAKNESGIISKIARTAISIAVTNKVLSKTKMKDMKNKTLLGFGLGIALNSINDKDEGDFTNTMLAAGALYGGSKISKKIISDNGDTITKGLFKLNEKNKNFREAIFDFNQKRKEYKAGMHNFKDMEEKIDFYFDIKTKSKAFQAYENKGATSDFIQYANAKNGYIDPQFSNYFNKREQINKRGGFGFFDRTLKNLSIENGQIVFNKKQIIENSRNDISVVNTFLNHFKKDLKNFNENIKSDDEFNMDNFLSYLNQKNIDPKNKVNNEKLINDFKEHYKKITNNNNVSLKDINNDEGIRKSLLEKTKSLSFLNNYHTSKDGDITIDNSKIFKLFGDINIKDLSKDSNGKIYDSSILDIENLFLDTMQMIDKSIRPPFSFIPGEKQNFSLVPFDIKARILKKESSDFKIIQTETDYDGTIKNLEDMKKHINNNRYKFLGLNENDLSKNKDAFLSEIDDKINYYKYEQDFIKNNNYINPEFEKTKINFFFKYDDNLNLNIIEQKDKSIKAYINDNKKLNYLSGKEWIEKEGDYGFTYSKMFKENETAKYNASLAKNFGEFGQFEEGLNDDSGLSMLKKKFHNWTDKSKSKFIKEINEDMDVLKYQRDKLINDLYQSKYTSQYDNVNDFTKAIYKNGYIDLSSNKELKTLIDTEKAFLYRSNINSDSIFDLDIKNTDFLKDINNADITAKEQFMKNLLNTDYFKNGNEDLMFKGKHFNLDYLKENYYKSLVPSKRGMLYKESEGISDWFSTNKDSIGTMENAYFNNFLNKFENSLNFVGKKKLDPSENYSTTTHLTNVMMKRVMPFLGLIYGYKFIEGATDLMTPEDSMFGNAGIGGVAAKILAGTRLGLQVMAENTGIKASAQFLIDQGLGFIEATGLNLSSEEMYQRYFEGKLAPVKRNRFWYSSGRNGFEGDDIKEYKQHFLYKMQNRDEMFYNSKSERFIREDFVVTKYLSRLIDPYLEERRLFEKGLPLDKSEQLFRDIPIFGEALSATIGQLIKPTIYYGDNTNEFSTPLRIANNALEDLKAFGGLQGYALSKATDFMLGGKSIKDIALNAGFETRELASIDAITGLSPQFDSLDLGGMFGATEPIRRILGNNNKERNSNMQNNLPKWFASANRKNNLELLDEDNLNPLNYKQKFELNPDDKYKDYGLLDRLKIMATTNPNSKEYYNYKNMAIANMNKGIYNNNQITDILQSISMADNMVNYNEYKKDQYVKDTKFEDIQINIDKVINHNEIIYDGKRIKLAGISDDFDLVSRKIGTTKALEEKQRIKSFLESKKELNVRINSDMLKNVKSDSKGQYIEVFSNEIYKDSQYTEKTYFQQSENGIIKNTFNKFFDTVLAQTFDVNKNKFFSNKSAYDSWEDNLTIPSFRDWDNPYDSFIRPTGDLAAGDFSQKILAINILSQNSLTKDLSLSSGLGAGYLLGNAFFGDSKGNYDKESQINSLYQKELYNNNINNTYEINENSTNNEIAKTLTQNDQKYFYALINEVNDEKINKIHSLGNNELKKAIEIINNKKKNYIFGTNQRIEQEQEMPERIKPKFQFEYDYFYNTGNIKMQNNMPLSKLEKRKLLNQKFKKTDFNIQISQEELRRRIYNTNSNITSEIYDNNNTFRY